MITTFEMEKRCIILASFAGTISQIRVFRKALSLHNPNNSFLLPPVKCKRGYTSTTEEIRSTIPLHSLIIQIEVLTLEMRNKPKRFLESNCQEQWHVLRIHLGLRSMFHDLL